MDKIKICVAGATGWVGSLLVKRLAESKDFSLMGVIARKNAGRDIGEVLGLPPAGILISKSLDDLSGGHPDVLIDYTKPDSVKERTLAALAKGIRVVIGTSGLSAKDFEDIQKEADRQKLGVIASGNFSITAALATHFSLIAAQHLPSWEIIDYAHADKIDAPSGTTRELAERLSHVRHNHIERDVNSLHGFKEARGATIAGTQIHSVRLHSYVIAFETIFGLPNERLTIRHDAGPGAEPYIAGTLLATKKVMDITGLIRGLDRLLFS